MKDSSEGILTAQAGLVSRIGIGGVALAAITDHAAVITMPVAIVLSALVIGHAITCAAYSISRGLAKNELRIPNGK